MASLECGICGNGIHYHDEADGTQILFIKTSEWERLIKTDMFISRYLLDGTEDYFYAWKCKNCGSLITLDPVTWQVINTYSLAEENVDEKTDHDQYIMFDDITWDKITEERIQGKDLIAKFPGLIVANATVNANSINIYSSDDLTDIVGSYKAS